MREAIVAFHERHLLPAGRRADADRPNQLALEAQPGALAIVLALVERIRPPGHRHASDDAIDRSMLDRVLELGGCLLFTTPCQRERQAAAPSGHGPPRQPRAVRESVAVFAGQHRHHHQPQRMAVDDAGRIRGVAGPFDMDRTFVDDDHQQNLRRVGDRREPSQDLDVFEPFGGPEPGRDLVHGARIDRRADLDAGETAHLVIFGDGVAVDLDRGNCVAALLDFALVALRRGKRARYGGPPYPWRRWFRPADEQQNDRCPHGQRIVTLAVTSARR